MALGAVQFAEIVAALGAVTTCAYELASGCGLWFF